MTQRPITCPTDWATPRATAALVAIATLAPFAGCGGAAPTTLSPSSSSSDGGGGFSDGGIAPEAASGDAAAHAAACVPRARSCTFKGFAPAVVYPTANEPLSILAVDRTCSGHLDLVVGE